MLHVRGGLFWGLCVLLGACRAAPQSGAGTGSPPLLQSQSGRRLHGRFLHVSDVHPDPFYKTYSSTEAESACHRKRGPAGVYGAETSGCDSPISLVNETFKWINENLKDDIDFVIWTGDSARHDNDELIPRTQKQIIEQNEFLVAKFTEVFGKDDNINDTDPTNDFTIPIVPTFGNNDIMPHNIFLSGPNKWTLKYLDVWRKFIPEEQRHQFQRGGWFFTEVIPRKLAVISLNTLYFFDSNSGVDGCADKHEPGYEHMEWLRIQLQTLRDRGMKVILMGHVPPARTDSKLSWDETCWQKFTLNQRQYRDIIVGSLFGHMNIDHFMLQDFKDLKKDTKNGRMASAAKVKSTDLRENMLKDGEVTVASASDYLLDLRDAWAKLPSPQKSVSKSLSIFEYIDANDENGNFSVWEWFVQKISSSKKGGDGGKESKKVDKKKFLDKIGGKYGERFGVSHVSPSVVPNYFPTLRVFEYNITGLEDLIIPANDNPSRNLPPESLLSPYSFSNDEDWECYVYRIINNQKTKKEQDTIKKPKKYKFKIPTPPSKSAPPGPAYSPQSLTLLSYTQYFANLTYINNDFTAPGENLLLLDDHDDDVDLAKWKEGKHRKHQGKKPRPNPHPETFKFEVEYDTKTDKLFKLKDLTVRSYVDLARRIGNDQEGKKLVEMPEQEVEDEDDGGDDSGCESDDSDFEVEKKKRKHKKQKDGKKHKHKKDGAWFTFVKRAFVGTMDPRDIEELFCERSVEFIEQGVGQKVLEL
ncbi:Endopolyphosphatase [Lindgomyces ingoldianus]|uniref:Endopolyphosphatase n=1 Tax=Lindgomyces ingoldianus TaxID=673940 RepID=A0ACB6Q883_9PLEO|nr:Endopolyphosphatase [Lindgomyces ingoldianus]KAF2463168.1 Endopolyphosphatase [Lindgomyces ingoldianus]